MDRAEFMIEVLLRGGKRKEREENKIENKKKKENEENDCHQNCNEPIKTEECYKCFTDLLSKADTFEKLKSINIKGMEDKLPIIWYYQNSDEIHKVSDPDGDSASLTDLDSRKKLILMNRRGFLTCGSQQGMSTGNHIQMETVDGYIHKNKLKQMIEKTIQKDSLFRFSVVTPNTNLDKKLQNYMAEVQDYMAEERYTVTFQENENKWHEETFMLGPMTEEEYRIQDSIQIAGINKNLKTKMLKDYVHIEFVDLLASRQFYLFDCILNALE
jgi:hypothetical protein